MRFPIFFIPAIMSGIAVLDMPYGYYTLLRIVVCGSGAFGAFLIYASYQWRWFLIPVAAVPAIIALLYNPLTAAHPDRLDTILHAASHYTFLALVGTARFSQSLDGYEHRIGGWNVG